MAIGKAAKIIRARAGKDATIFNDKCVNGDRSFKVWRWTEAEYMGAKAALKKAGMRAEITKTVSTDMWYGGDGKYVVTRLRVAAE